MSADPKSRNQAPPPSPLHPPVFGAPPNPPNPSIALSDTAEEDQLTNETSGEEQLGEFDDSSTDESDEDLSSDEDDSCCGEDNSPDIKIRSSIAPTNFDEYLSKFTATMTVQSELLSQDALLDKIKEIMQMEGKFDPLDGLTSPEPKRQGFLCYLKATGLLSAIVKILLGLYEMEELPEADNLPEYMCDLLGYVSTIRDDLSEGIAYNKMLEARIQRLRIENDWLRRRQDDFECSETRIEILEPDNFDPKLNEQHRYPDPVPVQKRLLKVQRRSIPGPTALTEHQHHEQIDHMEKAIHEFDSLERENEHILQKMSLALASVVHDPEI